MVKPMGNFIAEIKIILLFTHHERNLVTVQQIQSLDLNKLAAILST